MRILIFGTGDYYNRYKKWLEEKDVLALVDNDKQKIGTMMDGKPIISPFEIKKYEFDYILILSFCYLDMKNQLLEYGVEECKIVHFYTLRRIIDWRKSPKDLTVRAQTLEPSSDGKKKILLLSPELNNGGPAIALFHCAKTLKKNHYEVTVVSMIDGELSEKYRRENIPVIIDFNLQLSTMVEEPWMNMYDCIFCNTINFHVFLSERITSIPCIWWLHDSSFFYEGVNKTVISNISTENLFVFSVGDIPKAAIKTFLPELNVEELLYGTIWKQSGKKAAGKRRIVRFITIGLLEEIKGQDVLFSSVRKIYSKIKDETEFCIVGRDDTLFAKQLKEEYKDIQNVKFTGILNREELHKYIENSDVLICPSRQDSMPTVVAEAMMHSKPCIVSDSVGTAKYISNGVEGLIFETEKIEDLADKIQWCVENREKLCWMGKQAERLFEKKFSMSAFQRNLLGIMEGIEPYIKKERLRV